MNRRTFSFLAILLVSGVALGPRSAFATTITLTDFRADMRSIIDPRTGNETITLLVNSAFFGPGGIAGGQAAVGANPPNDTLWLADPFLTAPPGDQTPALRFQLDPSGHVLGVDPTPFRIFLASPPDDTRPATLIGELDFSGVSGTKGSLSLSGVIVHEVDTLGHQTGVSHNVEPFTITQAVPETAGRLLLGITMVAMLGCGWRWGLIRPDRPEPR